MTPEKVCEKNMGSYLIIGAPATYGTILFVSLSFLLLLLLIKHFAWDAIAKVMNDRAKKVADDIDNAEQARIEAQKLASQRERELTNSRRDASQIVQTAKETAEKNSQAIIKEAHEKAVHLKQQAEKDIQAQQQKAFDTVKDDVAELSIQIASKILQKELDQQAHETLINACIEGLEKQNEAR